MARCRLDDLALFDELFVVGAAFDELERALFLDDLRRGARVVAASADGADEAGALHAAGEFANGRKRRFIAAFRYFCIDTHCARVYHGIKPFGKACCLCSLSELVFFGYVRRYLIGLLHPESFDYFSEGLIRCHLHFIAVNAGHRE